MAILAGQETSAANFPATASIYNSTAGEWFAAYTVLESGSIDTLETNIFDMWTATGFKLTLRDATGGLLGVTGSLSGTGVQQGAITPVAVTTGQTVYLGLLPDTGYIKPRQNATTYAIRKDAVSTFAAPAADVDEGSAMQGTPLFAVNAQGTTGAPTAEVTKLQITHNGVSDEQYFTSTPSGDDVVLTVDGPIVRTTLPPIGEVTVEGLDAEDNIIFSGDSNLIPPVGSKAMIVASADTEDPNSVFYYTLSGTPADGDQVEYIGANTTISPSGIVSQSVAEAVQVRHWDLGTTSYGEWANFGVLGVPTLVISAGSSNLLAGQTTTVTFTFSVAAVGFTQGDISITGGTLTPIATVDGGITYTSTLTPTPDYDGDITITVEDDSYSDGEENGTGDELIIQSATITPSLVITASDYNLAPLETATLTFTFSEEVSGFVVGDIVATNGTLSSFATSDDIVWTVLFTPTPDINATANISVAQGSYVDLDGNEGSAASRSIILRGDPDSIVVEPDYCEHIYSNLSVNIWEDHYTGLYISCHEEDLNSDLSKDL